MKIFLVMSLVAAGCSVSPADWAGQACDATHDCFEGRECLAGRCAAPTTVDGGHSCVAWSQRRDGFATTRAGTGASAEVAVDQGNRLTANVPSALDGSDFAVAQIPSGRLTVASEGQLTGRIFVPLGINIDGPAPFLALGGVGGSILELTFLQNWELSAFTGTAVLQAQPVSSPRSSQRFSPGVEYTLRASWRIGSFRRIWINNAIVFDDVLQPFSGSGARPTQLELGVLRYDGNGQNPLQLSLSDFQLCDDADVTL